MGLTEKYEGIDYAIFFDLQTIIKNPAFCA